MKIRSHAHHIGRSLAVTGAVMLGLSMLAPVSADPPGNNGTIKIDGVAFDTHPDNQPHVGCIFQVDFYGYEANVPVEMEFSVQPPTGSKVIRVVEGSLDGDDATGGGSQAGIDGQFTVDLTGALAAFTPHPNQGYHVKLTITADDGTRQGSDGKSKVFWVGPCSVPPTTTTTTVAPTTTTTAAATTTTAAAATTTTSSAAANVLGITVTPPTSTNPEVLGVELPRTGFSATLLLVGVVMLSLGLLFEGFAQLAKRREALS